MWRWHREIRSRAIASIRCDLQLAATTSRVPVFRQDTYIWS